MLSSATLPFGYLDQVPTTAGRFVTTASFWGFAGVCDCASPNLVTLSVSGVSRDAESLTCSSTQYACVVTWDSGENAELTSRATVSMTLNGGHAAYISWNISAPEILFSSVDDDERPPGFLNNASELVLPRNKSVIKGQQPVSVVATLTYVIFKDSTTRASVREAQG